MRRLSRSRTGIWIGFLCAAFVAAPGSASVVVYVVRHAEKADTPGERDPELSDAGRRRAQALARTLSSVKLTAIYATQFKRTQQTVAPVAATKELEAQQYPAGKEASLAERLRAEKSGRTLVSGHSNTVPAILKALGVDESVTLSESDYDDLFVVFIDDEGAATLQHLHYGDESP